MSSVVSASRSRTSSAKRKAKVVQQISPVERQAGPDSVAFAQREAAKDVALRKYREAMASKRKG